MSDLVSSISFKNKKEKIIDNNMMLEEIFEEYSLRLYKYFIYRTNDVYISEDLTSIVFEKIVINIDNYDSNKSPLGVWIFIIARNAMYDYFKGSKNKQGLSIDDYIDTLKSNKNTEKIVESSERKEEILRALQALTERENNIISYKFGAGLTNIEISEVMGLSVSNVGTILYRSLKKLKKIIGEDYYESR